MKKVKVYITLRESVLDPQGQAVNDSLHNMGYDTVKDVRIGKYVELMLEKTDDLEQKVEEVCEKLLANTVIEDYRYEVEDGDDA
jgi:phosphoribosylformylglycinamidine synthase